MRDRICLLKPQLTVSGLLIGHQWLLGIIKCNDLSKPIVENQNVSSLNHDIILGKNKRKRKTNKKIVLCFWKQTLKIRNLSVFIPPKYDWTKAKDTGHYFASCLETALCWEQATLKLWKTRSSHFSTQSFLQS